MMPGEMALLEVNHHCFIKFFMIFKKPWRRMTCISFFSVNSLWPRAPGFLKFFCPHVSMRVCVCLSVCPPPRPLITSGVIWCDIDLVRLVKQVLRLFPAFNYFIWQLPSIKWMGVAILTQLVVNACQRKLR